MKKGIYEKYIKRVLDIVLSGIAMVVLSPLFIFLILIGIVIMKGNPFFVQLRPGKDEKIFRLVKFRTMTNEKDEQGVLLPDDERLIPYGKFLRSSSLDELPELINIFMGDMSIVGPRPQLVRDMVFMTAKQRKRHSVRQGLTGLAQVNGRNGMKWEEKLEYDLQYIKRITFKGDVEILIKTIRAVLKKEGISADGMETAEDLGDYLLHSGKINNEEYLKKQKEALKLIGER